MWSTIATVFLVIGIIGLGVVIVLGVKWNLIDMIGKSTGWNAKRTIKKYNERHGDNAEHTDMLKKEREKSMIPDGSHTEELLSETKKGKSQGSTILTKTENNFQSYGKNQVNGKRESVPTGVIKRTMDRLKNGKTPTDVIGFSPRQEKTDIEPSLKTSQSAQNPVNSPIDRVYTEQKENLERKAPSIEATTILDEKTSLLIEEDEHIEDTNTSSSGTTILDGNSPTGNYATVEEGNLDFSEIEDEELDFSVVDDEDEDFFSIEDVEDEGYSQQTFDTGFLESNLINRTGGTTVLGGVDGVVEEETTEHTTILEESSGVSEDHTTILEPETIQGEVETDQTTILDQEDMEDQELEKEDKVELTPINPISGYVIDGTTGVNPIGEINVEEDVIIGIDEPEQEDIEIVHEEGEVEDLHAQDEVVDTEGKTAIMEGDAPRGYHSLVQEEDMEFTQFKVVEVISSYDGRVVMR